MSLSLPTINYMDPDIFTESYSMSMSNKLRNMGINDYWIKYEESREYNSKKLELLIKIRLIANSIKKKSIFVYRDISLSDYLMSPKADILSLEQEKAFDDIVRMIRCQENRSKEVRLCKSLHILSNRDCINSERCWILENERY